MRPTTFEETAAAIFAILGPGHLSNLLEIAMTLNAPEPSFEPAPAHQRAKGSFSSATSISPIPRIYRAFVVSFRGPVM